MKNNLPVFASFILLLTTACHKTSTPQWEYSKLTDQMTDHVSYRACHLSEDGNAKLCFEKSNSMVTRAYGVDKAILEDTAIDILCPDECTVLMRGDRNPAFPDEGEDLSNDSIMFMPPGDLYELVKKSSIVRIEVQSKLYTFHTNGLKL